jgi:hypothetical protein
MSAANSVPLEIVEEEEIMNKEDVLNYLIAIGVNTCNRSYDTAHKQMKESFLAMPLKEIAPSWDYLDDAVKISIINNHIDEFKSWVNGK